jgi:hypothetical protein
MDRFAIQSNRGSTKVVGSREDEIHHPRTQQPKDKSSAEDNEAKLEKYTRAIKSTKDRFVDSKHLCDVTPWMEGSIILSYLTGTNKARDFLMAEIKHRGIKLPATNSTSINLKILF